MKMVGPGASEIVSQSSFRRWVLHLAFDTDAFTLSPTCGVALVSPAISNVIALNSERTGRGPFVS